MRLISCIGILMVIPAIALLTHSNEPQVDKSPAVDTHSHDKKLPHVEMKSNSHADSLSHDKMVHSNLSTSIHLSFPASSYAQANPLANKK